ncbi:uncharacterized protein LOC126626843 [Malus sylvestris]|uniref:uncharacterized protein LOC126626843 n=1 Tax=Malus sylvestris TaxID=3752 RepID=UPI0021AC573A|nr:uncharacterized protein LOC126626843 [Malus sylvestris]
MTWVPPVTPTVFLRRLRLGSGPPVQFPSMKMVSETRRTILSNDHEGEAEAENRNVSELVSALRAASRAEDFARIEEALAGREAELKREIERQRHEKALMEEKHEFERLEKLKAEDELRVKLSVMVKAEAVSEDKFPVKDQSNEVISGKRRNMQRRRSKPLAAISNNCEVGSASSVERNGGLPIAGYGRDANMLMKRKNMEKTKMRKRENRVQYRCNMIAFFNTMRRVKRHLTERHLELLQQSPFWPLISAFYRGVISIDQCKKSDNDICNIIKCYNYRTMSFDFGSTSASLTTEDIAEILGIPQEGQEAVELKGLRNYKSDFTKRYFKVKTVSKKLVEDALEEAIKGKREADVEDVVRLIVLELCVTFLLCSSSTETSWNIVKYCEDLENISRYSWAKAVADHLHKSLEKSTRTFKPYSVHGCVVVIMLWLCERTNLIQPINGREGHKPAIVKWSVKELQMKLRHIDVADIGLSFKENKKKRRENERTCEEAKFDGREDKEGEILFDDTTGSLEGEFRAQKTQMHFLPTNIDSKRLNDEEDSEQSLEDLCEMIQNGSTEVAKAQGRVDSEKSESTNDKRERLKRKLKEEKEEKRKLKEDYEFLIGEQKSLIQSVKSFAKKLQGTLEAEREEVKHLKEDKMELIKEIQELRDQLNRWTPSAAMQLRDGIQIEKSNVRRTFDPAFENEQGENKKVKVEGEKVEKILSDAIDEVGY